MTTTQVIKEATVLLALSTFCVIALCSMLEGLL